ncbi:MAG: hypothetical protein IKO63_06760 [Paludibacteraceae bacterium]|nr:hypothetical protein [Paludibacteraceae bacterium]
MKHINSLLILLIALFCGISMEAGAATCGQSFSNGGKTITANFETINGKYVITLMASGSDYFSVPAGNWWVNAVDWATKATGDGTNTLVITLDSNPNLGTNANGLSWYMNGNTSSAYQIYGYQMPSIDWSGTCAPPDTHNPVISSVVAQSTTQTSITVRVTATDNQADDTGVASITVTRRGSAPSQTQTFTPATASGYKDFTFSGLTAGTTYTFDVTVTDAAGRTASTSQNLATQAAVVDNTPPSITSAAAENVKATTADIRVQATDNIGITRVVIKNGDATIKDESISSTTSLNQAFTLTGLTKNTTYGNIKVIVYDAHPNASSTYNVASFTTKDTQIIYFVKSGTSSGGGWGATPKVHYAGGWETSTWPGVDMTNTGLTNCDGTQIWRAEIPSNTTTVVFNNGNSGSGNQSSDQTPLANQYFNLERNTWYSPENLYILGNDEKLGNWTRSDAVKFSTWGGSAPTSVTKTLRLTGGNTYQFKIQYYDGVNEWWRGNSGTMTSANCTEWFMGDNDNCRITTTITGNYTFTYDFTANKLSVTYPVPSVGCSGNGTASQQTRIDYTITYAGGNIIFNVRSNNGDPITECDLCYGKNQYASATVQAMTISNGEATYSLPATGDLASGTLYFYFSYKNTNNYKSGTTSSLSSGAFTYNIGGCQLEDGMPYMLSLSRQSATTSAIVLNVSGLVYVDAVQTSVTQFRVSVNGGAYSTYTATDGKITIDGLDFGTEYTFTVKAYYGGEESENSKTVTASTNRASNCGPVTWYQDNTTNYPIEFELRYNSETGDLTIVAHSLTSNDKLDYFHAESSLWTGAKVASINGEGEASVTITNAELADEGTVGGIFFVYSLESMGGNVQTAGSTDVVWPAVIYYVVGECEYSTQEEPKMLTAAVTNVRKEEVDVRFTSADNHTRAANMIYHVNVQSTTGYATEWDLTLSGRSSGDYTLRGLVPDVSYRVTVYCEDEDGYLSTADINPADRKQKVIDFTTTMEAGCSSGEDATAAVSTGPGWNPMAEGMTYELEYGKRDATHITLTFDLYYNAATTNLGLCVLERHVVNPGGDPEDIYYEAYLTADKTAYVTNYSDTEGHRHIEAVIGNDLIGIADVPFWSGDAWNADNTDFGVKIEWSYKATGEGGPSAAGYYPINPSKVIAGTACRGAFIITQSGRTPSVPTLPASVGDEITFDEHILYYRQFTPGQWEPFVIPFEVSSVEVYDPDENEMFELTPQTRTESGYYLLRKQVSGVSGEVFQDSWGA